jgi:hypothetical protein
MNPEMSLPPYLRDPDALRHDLDAEHSYLSAHLDRMLDGCGLVGAERDRIKAENVADIERGREGARSAVIKQLRMLGFEVPDDLGLTTAEA